MHWRKLLIALAGLLVLTVVGLATQDSMDEINAWLDQAFRWITIIVPILSVVIIVGVYIELAVKGLCHPAPPIDRPD